MDNQNNGVNQTPITEPTVVPTVEPNVNPTVVPTMDSNIAPQAPSTQAGSKKGIIIAVVALLIIGVGVGLYFGFFRKVTGKEVVNGTINKLFESGVKAAEKLENNVVIDYKKDIVQANGSLKASVETDDQEIKESLGNLKSLDLDYDIRLDLKTLSGSFDLTEKENDSEVISLNTLIKDKMLYFKTSKTSGVYKYDLTDQLDWDAIDISKLPEYKSNSLSKVVKKLQGYLKDAIKEEYIETESGEYTVAGETVKGMRTTIKLTEERLNEIERSVYNSLLNDDEGLTIYSEYLMKDKEEVKSQIEQSRDAVGKSTTNYNSTKVEQKKNNELTINIYTTKQGKFLALDALSEEENAKNGITAVSNNGTTVIKLHTKGQVVLKLDYNEKEKELIWKNDAEGNRNETIAVRFAEDGIEIKFTMDGLKLSLDLYEKIDSDTVKMNINAGIDYDMEGKKLNGKISYENNVKKIDEINTFDTTNSKNVESLSEAEQEQLSNELETALEKSIIFNMIMSLTKKNQVIETQTTYSNPYCSQAYACESTAGSYKICKYKEAGYEYNIMCPAN